MRREWVRFATPEERRATGAWWVDAPAQVEAQEERYFREFLASDGHRSATRVPPLTELVLEGGYWAARAREARLAELHQQQQAGRGRGGAAKRL